MKRKYDSRNKRNFIIILILGLFIIGVFSLFIYKYKHASKTLYEVAAGSVVQDTNKNNISVDDSATLGIRWNGVYYLNYQDNKINLGKRVIVYNAKTGLISLYGKFYRINENGKITELNDETKLDRSSDCSFYKLADREYLLVDTKITSDDGTISALNYLLVELDRMGNAKLSNNKLNLKTIKPTKLITSKYVFDIANEKLKYSELDIDLKKIIGTTNQYKEEEKPEASPSASDNVNNWVINNNINPQDIGGGIVNNNDNEGEITTMDEIKNKVKSTSVIRWHQGFTQIDIDYVVYDPYDEYSSIYINVSGGIGKVELKKDETHKTISGLLPDRTYTLAFVYTTIDKDTHELRPYTFDEFTVKTSKPTYSGRVIGYSRDTGMLTYRVDLEPDYHVDQVKATLTVYYNLLNDDGSFSEKTATIPLTINTGSGNTITGSVNLKAMDITNVTKLDFAKVTINSVSNSDVVITY